MKEISNNPHLHFNSLPKNICTPKQMYKDGWMKAYNDESDDYTFINHFVGEHIEAYEYKQVNFNGYFCPCNLFYVKYDENHPKENFGFIILADYKNQKQVNLLFNKKGFEKLSAARCKMFAGDNS